MIIEGKRLRVLTRKVQNAMMMMPAQPGTSLLTALMSCAPTMTLTDDHPIQARTLKMATIQCISKQHLSRT